MVGEEKRNVQKDARETMLFCRFQSCNEEYAEERFTDLKNMLPRAKVWGLEDHPCFLYVGLTGKLGAEEHNLKESPATKIKTWGTFSVFWFQISCQGSQ